MSQSQESEGFWDESESELLYDANLCIYKSGVESQESKFENERVRSQILHMENNLESESIITDALLSRAMYIDLELQLNTWMLTNTPWYVS